MTCSSQPSESYSDVQTPLSCYLRDRTSTVQHRRRCDGFKRTTAPWMQSIEAFPFGGSIRNFRSIALQRWCSSPAVLLPERFRVHLHLRRLAGNLSKHSSTGRSPCTDYSKPPTASAGFKSSQFDTANPESRGIPTRVPERLSPFLILARMAGFPTPARSPDEVP